MSGETSRNLIVPSVAPHFLRSRTHRHVFACRALVQVMRTTSSRSVQFAPHPKHSPKFCVLTCCCNNLNGRQRSKEMSWQSNPTTCLKLDNKSVQKMTARANVIISESAILLLWSGCPPRPSSTRPKPPRSKQHSWNKRTEHEELPQMRVMFQITGRNGPSPAHAPPTIHETFHKEIVRITCTKARDTNKCRIVCNMMGSAFVDDGRSGRSDHGGKKNTQLSHAHQICPYQCTTTHHKQCFEMDVPPIAMRFSNSNASQVQLLTSVFPRWQFAGPRRDHVRWYARGVVMHLSSRS